MSSGPEFTEVEQPLIDQLIALGWKHTTGNLDHPSVTGREDFRDVLLLDDLRQALRRINLDPKGNEWLDDSRIAQAINSLKRLRAPTLLEANQEATKLIQKGTVVDGVDGWEDGRGRQVHFIDWDNPENNTFRVINQYRVKCPVGQPKKFIDPDIVLFVNGIPLVVIECKRRAENTKAQLEEAVDQLQRYANRRRALGVVDWNEGNEQLFHYNQFVVATCYDEARVGTFTATAGHFLEWKDTSPVPMADVAKQMGKESLSRQETLVAGMLRPAHLLDIIRHFTLFLEIGGRTIKAVCRYQQFRAVQLAMQRLLTGKTRAKDGEYDRRGGIIWHTQGSGKSLTMVFLVRKMRSHPDLRRFKIVVVTDRKSLEKQLADTAELTEEPLTRVKAQRKGQRTFSSLEVLKETLSRQGKDLVFAMIQKYRGEKVDAADSDDEEMEVEEAEAISKGEQTQPLPVLNEDEGILVLVDEAHRSHASTLHANLMNAMPNCARIGFTGTPIIMGDRKRTHEIFGDFIDRYTIQESEADGATVKILYEGRTTKSEVEGGGDLDEKFEDMFDLEEWTTEEREKIKRKYGTKGHVMEAERLIAAKAKDMLRHYVANIMPNGFKAQLVAVSRRATIRYYNALVKARDELVKELEALEPELINASDLEIAELDPKKAFLVRAHRFLPTIKKLEFSPVISGRHNDTVDPQGEWTDRGKIDARIARFKKPLLDPDPSKTDPLAFLIVKSMLLTGFDAPVEQVMYLDRHIKEADLLQAIARVNRTYSRGEVEKSCGIVVDYYGVARHLNEALAAYSQEDVEGALVSLKDEIPKLRDRHQRVMDLFAERGVEDVGRLSEWERKQLVGRFASWRHPNVPEASKAAKLGNGNKEAARRVLAALDRLLLVPTPGEEQDPYARLHDKTVNAVKRLLSDPSATPSQLLDAAEQLVLQIEPCVYKLLALFEPETYRKMIGKRRGLDAGLIALAKCGRSRYTLQLSREEFECSEGWDKRMTYDNAVRDVMPARLDAAHRAPEVSSHLWESAMTVLLGLVDHNLADLETLPEPEPVEVSGQERCVALLRDERLRAEFHVKLKQFLASLDTVLPRPEALPYVNDAKVLSLIQAKARYRYRSGERLIGTEVGEKVRKLIDDHIDAKDPQTKVPPVSITDGNFAERVDQERSDEAKASEMEHALRYHIRKHFDEDPTHYKKLSERLEGILGDLANRWDQLAAELERLVEEARAGRQADDTGLDPETQAPFFDLLKKEAAGKRKLSSKMKEDLCSLTVELVDHIRQEVKIVSFWKKVDAQQALRNWIFQTLDGADLLPFDRLPQITDGLMELAKANHHKLNR